jgi:hypothetical protein
MLTNRADAVSFFNGTDYWLRTQRLRPSAMHTPRFMYDALGDVTVDDVKDELREGALELELASESHAAYKGVLLHEALFHYYKAWYNYLAARTLYAGGFLHWIEITLYYSQFYLANAVVVLGGRSLYSVYPDDLHYVAALPRALGAKMNGHYRVSTSLSPDRIAFCIDRKRAESHRGLWQRYEGLPDILELQDMAGAKRVLARFGAKADYLSVERTKENYSFDGYAQVDFNLPMGTFEQFFERDLTKTYESKLYDDISAGVMLSLFEMYRLFRNFGVDNLPLEIDKHVYMIKYMLGESEVATNLCLLASEGFTVSALSSFDGDQYFDEAGRTL